MQKWKRQLFSPKLAEGSDKDTIRISFRNRFLFFENQFIAISCKTEQTTYDRGRRTQRENGRREGDVEGEGEIDRQKGYFG